MERGVGEIFSDHGVHHDTKAVAEKDVTEAVIPIGDSNKKEMFL